MTAKIQTTEDERDTRARPGIGEQRMRIRDAAVELFIAEGSRSVSVSQICKAAAVSRDTFYRCFPDKDALIDHLYQTSVNEHIETITSSWDLDYSDPQWLHEAFDQTIDSILEQHKVAQFLFVESADPQSPAYAAVNRAYDNAVVAMQRWCRRTERVVPSRELLLSLLVAAQWLVHNAIVEGMQHRHVARAKQASEELFFAVFSTRDTLQK